MNSSITDIELVLDIEIGFHVQRYRDGKVEGELWRTLHVCGDKASIHYASG